MHACMHEYVFLPIYLAVRQTEEIQSIFEVGSERLFYFLHNYIYCSRFVSKRQPFFMEKSGKSAFFRLFYGFYPVKIDVAVAVGVFVQIILMIFFRGDELTQGQIFDHDGLEIVLLQFFQKGFRCLPDF